MFDVARELEQIRQAGLAMDVRRDIEHLAAASFFRNEPSADSRI
jgi:hypothetical protein